MHAENTLYITLHSLHTAPALHLHTAIYLFVVQQSLPLILPHKVNLKAIDLSPSALAAYMIPLSASKLHRRWT